MKTKILSLLLLCAMLVTAVPFAVSAAEETDVTESKIEIEATDDGYVILDSLYAEGMTAHFSAFGDNASTVDLAAGTWTDLVGGKTATFSVGGTNYWRVNANGSVGYTTFRGELKNGTVSASSSYNNYKKAANRLQLGLALLPESDFSVEYLAMYKPVYVYDATQADKIARNEDKSLMETYDELFLEDPGYQVEYPIDQLGWFTSFTSYLDNTKQVWDAWGQTYAEKNPFSVERGATHFLFDCPSWYYKRYDGDASHNNWYVGGGGHNPKSGLNILTDAYQKNNEINTYGIYLDEEETVSGATSVATALFSLYRNGVLYNSNASKINSSANADGGTAYYDLDTPFSESHNFWLSSTRATDFFTVRIYDRVLNDAEKKQNRAVDVLQYYGIKIRADKAENAEILASIFEAVADELLVADASLYEAKAYSLQKTVEACCVILADLDSLYAEGMTAHFSVFGDNASTVDLAAGTWTDLVGGKTATFSVGGTNYWRVNANGSVGYTTFRGELKNGTVSASSSYNNYKKAANRLQLGLALLPESDFSVEYLAMYKPVYVYDATQADKIARNEDKSLMETYDELFLEDPGYQVEYPIDQLGWFTSFTSYLDNTKHVWDAWGQTYAEKNPLSVERGATHFLFDCPSWYYKRSDTDVSHNNWYVGGGGHNKTSGLNIVTDAYQKNNEINTYGIYLDEEETVSGATSVATALFSLYRNGVLYNSNASKINSSANADGGTAYYDLDTPFSESHNFWLSSTRATDFFTVRIYDRVLSDAEKKQNHAVDVLQYYGIKVSLEVVENETMLARVFETVVNETLVTDASAYTAKAYSIQKKVDDCGSPYLGIGDLYVKEGLVAFYSAYTGEEAYLSTVGNNMLWKNRVLGAADATFENKGWAYNATYGGVGYDLIYGQIKADGTFSASYTGNTYYNENKLNIGLSLLPKDDYTLEYVALYTPQYVYDARVGKIVSAPESGVSTAITPNQIIGHPVDVIGFVSSYTMHRGHMFDPKSSIENRVGLLRWRAADALGYKVWTSEYGMGNSNRIDNRATGGIETYGLTRDESVSGETVSAVYTHLFNGGVQHTMNCTSTKTSGDNRYFTFDDDTEFYLSHKLGTTFYALRVYNRVLTADEIAQNRAADLIAYYGIQLPDDILDVKERLDYLLALCASLDFEDTTEAYNENKRILQKAIKGYTKEVTLLVGEEEEVSFIYGNEYVLPATVEGAATLVAWCLLDEEGEIASRHVPGDVVTLTEDEVTFRAITTYAPQTDYGVSVRPMAEDGFGMRFTASVDKESFLALVDEFGADRISLSMIITPKQYVERAGTFTREALRKYVTMNGKDAGRAYVEIVSDGFYAVGENICLLAGTLYSFTDVTIAKNPDFAAVGCIDIDIDGDGSRDVSVYGDYLASTCRSPKKTIESVLYMNAALTTTQRKWVDEFLKNYTDNTYGGPKTITEQRAEISLAFTTAMNTTVEYVVHPFAEGEVAEKYAHIQAISFDGLSVDGKKTRVFAYVGLPEGASPENPVPAMVLVHGGGGSAYMEWVRLWNERGYAAIAMETVGQFPTSPGANVTEGTVSTTRDYFPDYILDVIDESEYAIAPNRVMKTAYAEVDEHWQYHGLSAVILSHNVLRQNACIDTARIGIEGVSWGGTMVSQVIGYDTRFAFAIPIYGSAYISEPERPFIGSVYVHDLWAAEKNLDNFKNPILWFDWADDNNFVVSSYSKSYLHSMKNNDKTALVILKDWNHSHRYGWTKEHGYAFADSICFPDRAAEYATFTSLPTADSAQSTVSLPAGATNVKAKIVYLTEPIVYSTFQKYSITSSYVTEYWKQDTTSLSVDPATGKITGEIPDEVMYYYISVTYTVDGRELETSSSFISRGGVAK